MPETASKLYSFQRLTLSLPINSYLQLQCYFTGAGIKAVENIDIMMVHELIYIYS